MHIRAHRSRTPGVASLQYQQLTLYVNTAPYQIGLMQTHGNGKTRMCYDAIQKPCVPGLAILTPFFSMSAATIFIDASVATCSAHFKTSACTFSIAAYARSREFCSCRTSLWTEEKHSHTRRGTCYNVVTHRCMFRSWCDTSSTNRRSAATAAAASADERVITSMSAAAASRFAN